MPLSPWLQPKAVASVQYELARLQTRNATQQYGPFGNSPGIDPPEPEDDLPGSRNPNAKEQPSFRSQLPSTLYKMFESAVTTFASIAVLGLAGYSYHRYYKSIIIQKMENAFAPGDPVLELAGAGIDQKPLSAGFKHVVTSDSSDHWVPRHEQEKIDKMVSGETNGHYHLIIGEKGTGKSSMLLDAMRKVDGEGISMFEAHADLEIFRIRLGKALDYEFHEDYIGSLFSIRGPREGALLDIERAFNQLQKVALTRRAKKKGPLVLIVNCAHLIRDDEDGRDLLEMMQQRAEQWAASSLVTMIFNSDDYWVYERLKRYATRMEVLPVFDLPKDRAISALTEYRKKYFPDQRIATGILETVYEKVGGRLTFLNRVAKSDDMLKTCEKIKQAEKTWFLNQCWILGEEMDDDVMDQQKYASAAMVLAKALVDMEKETETSFDPVKGHLLPQIPLHKARQVMTRADFIQSYDHENIFTIDSNAMVRADSVPMQQAFREICAEEGFAEYLEATLDRISAIESLNRTRELTLKDLWTIQTGENRGKYEVLTKDTKGRESGRFEFTVKPDQVEDDVQS
ncbi:MAG: hypothetical protein Q9227_003693 [Pyrenula ochraceoflavens]